MQVRLTDSVFARSWESRFLCGSSFRIRSCITHCILSVCLSIRPSVRSRLVSCNSERKRMKVSKLVYGLSCNWKTVMPFCGHDVKRQCHSPGPTQLRHIVMNVFKLSNIPGNVALKCPHIQYVCTVKRLTTNVSQLSMCDCVCPMS